MPLEVRRFRCLQSNYGYLARDLATGAVAAVDAPDADAVLAEAGRVGWRIVLVVNTHWHPDHTGGNAAVKAATGAELVGPEEVRRAAPLDRAVRAGQAVELGDTTLQAIETGGHTLGHLSFHAPDARAVFTGDALFPLGCGRMFEGVAAQFWAGLERLAALPAETQVWAGHEYGADNARFALAVETDPGVREALEAARARYTAREPSSPTTIGTERALNPFLRAPRLHPDLPPADAFAALRARKDAFA